ncbi:hypothetical protein [Cryobacterium zhongshanensis]|uniref:Uncharacterized protein n=1 Tax=Cryobacterium zhongshanensis TaxID=2928153 RepID=A0AA41QW05_9MICO|nr:hypothetical protein [Cryobacterium zhongshanensis]MCI4658137.1 hypothetical protein [Cryobacterium zhongshanensis]
MNGRRPTPWGIVAIAAGAAGLVAAAGLLPTPVQAVLVAALVLAGPGSVLRIWVPMPASTAAVLVPAIGLTTLILLTTAMETLGHWQPAASLLTLSGVAIVGGLSRWRAARGAPDAPVPAGPAGIAPTRTEEAP